MKIFVLCRSTSLW